MQTPDNDWPFPVSASKSEPAVDINKLNQHQKQQLWLGIKLMNPGLADMLSNDAVIANLKSRFQASIIFTQTDVDNYLKAVIPQQRNG